MAAEPAPAALPPSIPAAETPRRKRHYRRTKPVTPEHRARLLENLRKAWRAPRRRRGPSTEAQKAAARANLGKARAASDDPANYDRYHSHKLKHGLQARTLEQTLRLLDEDPGEFEAHCERFRHVFAPADRVEERIVRRIAAATWRHLRLFKAQA